MTGVQTCALPIYSCIGIHYNICMKYSFVVLGEYDCSVHFAKFEEFLGGEYGVDSEAAFEHVLGLESWGIDRKSVV